MSEVRYEAALAAALLIFCDTADGTRADDAKRLARVVYAVLDAIYAAEAGLTL